MERSCNHAPSVKGSGFWWTCIECRRGMNAEERTHLETALVTLNTITGGATGSRYTIKQTKGFNGGAALWILVGPDGREIGKSHTHGVLEDHIRTLTEAFRSFRAAVKNERERQAA